MIQHDRVPLVAAFFQDRCFEAVKIGYFASRAFASGVKNSFRSAQPPTTYDGPDILRLVQRAVEACWKQLPAASC